MRTNQRIDGIDFWRGFALISIFINHSPENIFAHFTHRNFGFSDAAELFVFLSGISVALAYGRGFVAGPRMRAVMAMGRRVIKIYGVQIMISLAGIALLVAAATLLDDDDLIEDPDRDLFVTDPVRSIVALLGLAHQLSFFNILPMYIALLVMAPAFLALARIDRRWMLAASVLLYVVARALNLHFPTWPIEGRWYFNPFAWQLLFVIGLYIGLRPTIEGPRYHTGIFLACCVALVGSIVLLTNGFGLWPDLWENVRTLVGHDKNSLGWVRLLHFLVLAYVIFHSGITEWFRNTRLYAPLCLLGRYSLPVFATGEFMTVVAEVALDIDTEIPEGVLDAVAVIVGVGVQYGVALFFDARAKARKAKGAAARAAGHDDAAIAQPRARAHEPDALPAVTSPPKAPVLVSTARV